MLIRRKSSTDDEYHHADPLGVFKLVTGANAVTSGMVVADYFGRQIVTTGLKSSPYYATNLQAISQAGYLTTSQVYYAERSVSTKYRNPVDCLIDEINCLKQSQQEFGHCAKNCVPSLMKSGIVGCIAARLLTMGLGNNPKGVGFCIGRCTGILGFIVSKVCLQGCWNILQVERNSCACAYGFRTKHKPTAPCFQKVS